MRAPVLSGTQPHGPVRHMFMLRGTLQPLSLSLTMQAAVCWCFDCRYKALQQAAVTLQAACRGRQARASLQQLSAAAVVLQAAYRGWRVRQAIAESIPFIVKLQAYFRAGRQRTAFLRMRAAAVVLQAAVRGQQERCR